MLQCEYCDYHKTLPESSESNGKVKSVCKFTEFIFAGDITELNIEHPCSDVSYQTYIKKEEKAKKVVSFDKSSQKISHIDYQRKTSENKKSISA